MIVAVVLCPAAAAVVMAFNFARRGPRSRTCDVTEDRGVVMDLARAKQPATGLRRVELRTMSAAVIECGMYVAISSTDDL